MKQIIICEQRKSTMRTRLGQKALSLIDGDSHLPLFRNRQIHYEKEFAQSIKMVKSMKKAGKIRNVKHYFARIWAKENIERTLKIVEKFRNSLEAAIRERNLELKKLEMRKLIAENTNHENINRLREMKRDHGIV